MEYKSKIKSGIAGIALSTALCFNLGCDNRTSQEKLRLKEK